MRIGIDCRFWSQTGVGRYTRNLVENLQILDKENEYVLFVNPKDEKSVVEILNKGKWSIIPTDISWHSVSEQIKFPKVLNSQNLDLVHFPYFSVPVFYKKPFVITVHDLIVKKYNTGRASTLPLPLYLLKRAGYHAVLGSAIGRAKKIIVPSEAVEESMESEYPAIDKNKIVVTYEGGFESKLKAQSLKLKAIKGRYLLRVGNFYPHKNVEGLLKAFSLLFEDKEFADDLKLVLVGRRDYFYHKIEKLIEKLNLGPKVVFIENPGDESLACLYKNSVATVAPSFAEGFSLTTVEAMSLGSIVLASDISVHREICGTAAVYCNPRIAADIKQKINSILNLSESERKKIIEEGKKQSEKFSWEKMAKETLRIYNDALK